MNKEKFVRLQTFIPESQKLRVDALRNHRLTLNRIIEEALNVYLPMLECVPYLEREQFVRRMEDRRLAQQIAKHKMKRRATARLSVV